MIIVSRRNGSRFALNPDLVERIEETPDTVVTLVGGVKYVVSESVEQIIDQIRDYRASVVVAADHLGDHEPQAATPALTLVPGAER